MIKNISILLITLTLCACGGGGGNGEDNSPEILTPIGTSVNITAFKSIFLGTTENQNLHFTGISGSDSEGNKWSGNHAILGEGITIYSNINPYNQTSVAHNSTFINRTDNILIQIQRMNTNYFNYADSSFCEIRKHDNTNSATYLPSSYQSPLPSNPKIGDSGNLCQLIGSDGTTMSLSWELIADFNGRSILKITFIVKNNETVSYSETINYYLDSVGIPTKVILNIITNGITVTLSGNAKIDSP